MKRTTIICDCCRKEIPDDPFELRLPIYYQAGEQILLKPHNLDICSRCANRILIFYYELCKEFSNSDIMGMVVEDKEDK